jgi:bacteriorhodopsin
MIINIIVFISFLFYSLYELYYILNTKEENELKQQAQQTLFYIVGIATFAYAYIAYSNTETFSTRSIRYLDWIITTPLITYSYYLIGRINGVDVNFATLLVTNLLFIGFGIIAEYFYQTQGNTNVDTWFGIFSFIFFGIFIYNIYLLTQKLKDNGVNTRGLEYFFYIGWTLYGVVFILETMNLISRDIVVTSYSILDFINKIIYSVIANQVIINTN